MATERVTVESIGSYFESLADPRHTRNRKHLFIDIVVIAVCGLVCGCDGPTAIHRWAVNRAAWLAERLPLENGIPSRDCIRRVLMALKPEAFQQCFQNWIAAARPDIVVSATPSENTVRFYLGRGFQPMAEPLAELFELEPDDVHMCKVL